MCASSGLGEAEAARGERGGGRELGPHPDRPHCAWNREHTKTGGNAHQQRPSQSKDKLSHCVERKDKGSSICRWKTCPQCGRCAADTGLPRWWMSLGQKNVQDRRKYQKRAQW